MGREDRFESLYTRHYASIYAFVYRRSAEMGGEVSDVVAEVFAVAWRRLDRVPEPPEDLLWLYGVARRCVARARRSDWRRRRLHARLSQLARPDIDGHGDGGSLLPVRAAIERLHRSDREVLALVMWEGLTHAEAGQVLGCSPNAVALRLHKAKQRLRAELGADQTIAPVAMPAAEPGAPG